MTTPAIMFASTTTAISASYDQMNLCSDWTVLQLDCHSCYIYRHIRHNLVTYSHCLYVNQLLVIPYQTCTEVYQPTPSNGLYPAPGGDMFPPSVPNKTAIFDDCRSR